eukprot:5532067-Alexandrium_andersonii.AAC.1
MARSRHRVALATARSHPLPPLPNGMIPASVVLRQLHVGSSTCGRRFSCGPRRQGAGPMRVGGMLGAKREACAFVAIALFST